MNSTNPIVENALRNCEVSPISNRTKRRRTAHNERKPAVVLNVRQPSNPTQNRTRKAVAALAAALITISSVANADDARDWYQPVGWSKEAIAPMAYIEFNGFGSIAKLNGEGLIDLDSLDDVWREALDRTPEMEAAFKAMQTALQAKQEIGTLPPLDMAHTATITFGEFIYVADISCAYSNGIDYVDNHRFCAKPATQKTDENCLAASAVNYLAFANAYSGGKIPTAKMEDLWNGEPQPWPQTFDRYLKANPNLRHVDVIPMSGGVYGDLENDAGEVCAIVKLLIANYGGFMASIAATPEWFTLLPAFKHLWRGCEMTICGNSCGDFKNKGLHSVMAFGYDDDYVYVQNSWGEEWGYEGCAKIEWYEFARKFYKASVITDGDDFKKMLGSLKVKQKLHVKGLGEVNERKEKRTLQIKILGEGM